LFKQQDADLLSSELFSIEHLKRHAVLLASQHKIDPHPGPDKLLARLDHNEEVLISVYDLVTAAAVAGNKISSAESWLLDNYYLIEQQISLVRRHLPTGYSKQLPRLKNGVGAGFPRVYNLALNLISHMDGRVDSENANHIIAAYQTVEPLKLGELWAFPIMLKLALLENLRLVAQRIAVRHKEHDTAILWADRMLAAGKNEPKQLIQLLAEFAYADVPLTAPFVEDFYERLQAQGSPMAFVQMWVEQKLLEQGVTATQLSEVAGQAAAANQISIANSIASLRLIGTMDWQDFVESLSVVEHELRKDPTGAYLLQDFSTRDRYRHVIEEIARSGFCSELKVACEADRLAQAASALGQLNDRTAHVGYYLVDAGRLQLELQLGCVCSLHLRLIRACHPWRLGLYLLPIWLLSLHLTYELLPENTYRGLLAMPYLIACSALAVSLINLLVTQLLPPRSLPRLDFSKGVPSTQRTMVIVPTLLNSIDDVDHLVEALEIRYLGNRDDNIFFALLTDFDDALEQTLPNDEVIIMHARAAIDLLNVKYTHDRPCIFYLFHRPRIWNSCEKVWMGYERKRGKLEQFNELLRPTISQGIASQSGFSEIVGDQSILESIQYVITLDTDTQLPRDTGRTLIGNMAHPLNRPVYDEKRQCIIDGYAILQPRASISLTSANHSWFTKIYAGEPGVDPYTREVSDVYQDVFGEGTFIGKGIYDVDAFRLVLDGRFPENLVLSHDLLESGYARSALITDIDLIEDYPASYMIEMSRRHRWIRGDWQLMGWLLPNITVPASEVRISSESATTQRLPNPLTWLSVWKIIDNLRRSLVPPSILMLLTSGWLLGGKVAFINTAAALTILFLPTLIGNLIQLLRKTEEHDWLVHFNLTRKSATRPLMLDFLTLAFMPYETLICLNAIACSGLRMLISKRGLLIWKMPSYRTRNARTTLSKFYIEMWIGPVLSLSLACLVLILMTEMHHQITDLLFCLPVLVLWLLSPLIAWFISQPIIASASTLTTTQRLFLRISARRTWRYFAQFVSAEDHWLAPDNFQESPIPTIASRTSPTNIGMSLLANLTAHDLGYITTSELLIMTENTFASMEKLERYHGHFYNWYDTRSLVPLRPQYISTVDSGNLVGALLTLQAGMAELLNQPFVSPNVFHGLQDTLQVLVETVQHADAKDLLDKIALIQEALTNLIPSESVSTVPSHSIPMQDIVGSLQEIVYKGQELNTWLPIKMEESSELVYWVNAFNTQVQAILHEFQFILPVCNPQIPTLIELAQKLETNIDLLLSKNDSINHTQFAQKRIKIIQALILRCQNLSNMDFVFLYDSSCDLFSIGYDVAERRRDPSCYDLLASEARLASFLMIADGQVPQKHWFSLGRLLTSYGGEVGLISWSGSMFEYLMPQLIMPSYENTLLDQTAKAAVTRQIEYGKKRAVPWGISESCYNLTDINQVYQYRAFGIPGLGFKRGLGEDLVIAPYASALALIVMPQEACLNLQLMAGKGFLGSYGFYESVDYTPLRLPPGKQHVVVRSYMAHHQGMSLLAFGHALLNQPMQRRFMSFPSIQATSLLLQERIPKPSATLHPHAAEVTATAKPAIIDTVANMRIFQTPNTRMPEVHLLSNGNYHVMVTNAGGGYSRWRNLSVTRWREDATCDNWGTFIYLRDCDSGQYWSSAYQPTLQKADEYEAIFVQARAEYRRRDNAIETYTEISVSPEDDVEIRRVKLTNLSARTRHIEVTSYAEIVLAPLNSDMAHRAFSNLFVETEILLSRQAILCTRRRRTPDEEVPWMFHLLAAPSVPLLEGDDNLSYETDRARFIGRYRTVANPVALDSNTQSSTLSNTEGAVLDPIAAIRRTMTIGADDSVTLQIISGVANSREAALALLDKYCDKHFVERAFEMAWFHSQEVLRNINASEADAQLFGRLASNVIFNNPLRRTSPEIISRNRMTQSMLWKFGISGDLPIILLRIAKISRIELVRQMLQAHSYWRKKGVSADLVILNEDFSGYRSVLHDQIMGLINTGSEAHVIDQSGGVFVRRNEDLSEDDRTLLQAVSRVVLTDNTATLLQNIEQGDRRVSPERSSETTWFLQEPVLPWKLKFSQNAHAKHLPHIDRIFCNGLGGFSPDGREYIITLESGQSTPAPWVNVIASPFIGTVVSETGGAYTWMENAHEFRLTPWYNDPLSDSSGEAMYIRDEETGSFWSPTKSLVSDRNGYVCRHGFGYSIFEHHQHGITSELTEYVAMDAPVKFIVIKLHNQSGRSRNLSVTGYWELVLGEWREANMMHTITETDPITGAIFARNAYGRESANRVVFVSVSETDNTLTGSRNEFIGRNGSLNKPAAMSRKRLSGKTGAGIDPCAALQSHITLADGQEREIVFILGAARNAEEAQSYIKRFGRSAGARQALESVWGYWTDCLGAVQVETPDKALDLLANGWLIYQTLSSRLWGRSGYYQSGGAYGFRDQLQDTVALIHATPLLVREHLIRCAGRQFAEGDVQHWWHPPLGQGVRTHFSDDFLWLPYATCRYVQATGDTGILEETVNFLEGRLLSADEESYYDQPLTSQATASLYEHCTRAIKHGLRFGEHQLPLMGCGDWNDGMNLVGQAGKGESVWLGWFLYDNLQQFSALARIKEDFIFADFCLEQANVLRQNIEMHAWDGAWYKRAFFDDGTPLGSSENQECQIDSISQSWAVISKGGEATRALQALESVNQRLVKRDTKIIQLLDPPFDKSNLEPGYIKGYVPGVRENGGQYTHAAIWTSMAFAMVGNQQRAWELYSMLNPVHRGSQPQSMQTYKVEPYVLSADIYGAPPHVGRGGWTWYTGAAGWMYRLTIETLLGLHLEVDQLRITPCIPAEWQTYKIHYRFRDTSYHITITRVSQSDNHQSESLPKSEFIIPLVNDFEEHIVLVNI
jgi:cellobiose phosphorylase